MKKLLLFATLIAGVLLVSGCASGPGYAQMSASIPPVPANKGRLYFYRSSVVGAAVQPAVRLDGKEVGTAKSKGFFYIDADPGSHFVETTTEVSRRLTLTLETGQTRYVKLSISMGFAVGHVYPELVDDAVGKKGVEECKYTGTQ